MLSRMKKMDSKRRNRKKKKKDAQELYVIESKVRSKTRAKANKTKKHALIKNTGEMVAALLVRERWGLCITMVE